MIFYISVGLIIIFSTSYNIFMLAKLPWDHNMREASNSLECILMYQKAL